MNNTTITKQEFHDNFMVLLSEKLGYKSYFNSKNLINLEIKPILSDILGTCYLSRPGKPIVIKYRKGLQKEMLGTLIHEYAHAILHGEEKVDFNNYLKEVEAETVAQNVLKYFSIDNITPDYIDSYKKKVSESELNNYYKMQRNYLVEKLSNEIIEILKVKYSLIEKLSNNNSISRTKEVYKYNVICPCCTHVFKYKRKAEIIKKNAKGYWCSRCGKEKTYNKLTVVEI